MRSATKDNVRDYLGDNTEMGRPYREIMKLLAGQDDLVSASTITEAILPGRDSIVAAQRIHILRKKLEGSGFMIERVSGYRLVCEGDGE